MNKMIFLVFGLTFGGLAVADAQGPVKQAAVSVEGDVVDVACYMGHRVPSPQHPKCTKSCLMDGAPIGLLVKGQGLYLLLEDPGARQAYQALKQAAAVQVKVTGKTTKRGRVQTLVVQEAVVLGADPSACSEEPAINAPSAGYCGEPNPSPSPHTP